LASKLQTKKDKEKKKKMKGKRREETKRRKFTEDENRETRALWSCFVYYNELCIRFI
jgi:hypothetical protein